jgi:hypothetical protein
MRWVEHAASRYRWEICINSVSKKRSKMIPLGRSLDRREMNIIMDFNTFMAAHLYLGKKHMKTWCYFQQTWECDIVMSPLGVEKHTALTTHTFCFPLKFFVRCCNILLHTNQHCGRNVNLWSFIIITSQTFWRSTYLGGMGQSAAMYKINHRIRKFASLSTPISVSCMPVMKPRMF